MIKRTRLAIMFGGVVLASVGLTLAACSTDNGTTPLPGSGDSSSGGNKDGKADGPGSSGSDGETPGADAQADCEGAPKVSAHTGVFCFGGAGSDDGGACDPATNVCCADAKDDAGTFIKAKCAAPGACGFPQGSGREWHCTQQDHCAGGEACCVIKGTGGTPKALDDTKDFPGCGNYFNSDQGFNVGGSLCKQGSCDATELTLCSKDGDCKTGKCRYFKLANRNTGVCQ